MKTLDKVFKLQKQFQEQLSDKGYDQLTMKERAELIHTHTSFIIEECIEMLREVPFHKPWKDYSNWTDEKLNAQMEKTREEWIDVFIFLMNVGLLLDFDEELVEKMYMEKNNINHARQNDPNLGYQPTK